MFPRAQRRVQCPFLAGSTRSRPTQRRIKGSGLLLVLKPIRDARFSGRILVDLVSVRNGGRRDRCNLFRREALFLNACGK